MNDPLRVLVISRSLRQRSTNTTVLRTADEISGDVQAPLFGGMAGLAHFDPAPRVDGATGSGAGGDETCGTVFGLYASSGPMVGPALSEIFVSVSRGRSVQSRESFGSGECTVSLSSGALRGACRERVGYPRRDRLAGRSVSGWGCLLWIGAGVRLSRRCVACADRLVRRLSWRSRRA